MIRSCSKLLIPLPTRGGSPVCISRYYLVPKTNNVTHTILQRCYASEGSRPAKTFKKIFYSTLGITLIGAGGAIVYAKDDPKFRKVLDSYIPGTDKFISIIYQEDDSLSIDFNSVTNQLSTIKDKALTITSDIYKLVSSDEGTSEAKQKETLLLPTEVKSVEGDKPKPKPAVEVKKAPIAAVKVSNENTESSLKAIASDTLKIYNDSIKIVQDKGNEIIELIEKSAESADQKTWNDIRKKVEENKKALDDIENRAKAAGDKLKQFSSQLRNSKFAEGVTENLKSLENEMNQAKSKLEDLKSSRLGASTKYFNKIEEARKHFAEELTTLFPSVRLSDRQLRLSEEDIDLFLYYAVQKLLYYQKELNKLETLTSQRLRKAIQDSKESSLIQETVDAEVDKARREIKEDFEKKVLELKAGCDQEIHNQMKRQEQVHIDLLNDQLKLKEKEVERKLIQRLEDRVLEEQGKLQAELADMTGRMQGLNEAISRRALQDQKAMTSQALWSSAEALLATLKAKHEDPEALEPLAQKVDAIKQAAAKGDDLVETVVSTVPKCALQRGVYSEDALRRRFLRVEQVAWRVAGIPSDGGSLPKLLASWLQSLLIIKAEEPIPTSELNNQPIDPALLNNYDILQRARYWVDRGDFEQALKYMNLLRGGARSVSLDWMKEVTLLLETQQAANLLLAHAAASGMVYS